MEEQRKDAENLIKKIEEDSEMTRVEEFIKDNKIVFSFEGKKYRVRMLNLSEKNELDGLRRKKFGELIQDKDILMEKELIIKYKEKGVDIESLDDDYKKLEAEEIGLQLKLGEAISKNEGEIILNTYRNQIKDLRFSKNAISAQKSMLLEFSLENQLLSYVYQIFTYLSLEVMTESGWERNFKTCEEFLTSKEDSLIGIAAQYSILLQSI